MKINWNAWLGHFTDLKFKIDISSVLIYKLHSKLNNKKSLNKFYLVVNNSSHNSCFKASFCCSKEKSSDI